MIKFIVTAGLLLTATPAVANDSCLSWFKDLKILPNDPDCKIECAIGLVDMGTFGCPAKCDDLCGKPSPQKPPPCPLNSYWKGRLNGPAEPFSPIIGKDLGLLATALSRLPQSLQPSSLKALVRGTKSVDFSAPSSEATSTDEFIILYPKAFSRSGDLDRIVAHEAVHVLILEDWSQYFDKYKRESGWATARRDSYRTGEFVEIDGKTSPEEDFVNNVEYYLFDPNVLKAKSPKIFDWLKKNFAQRLQLEKGCNNEK